MTIRLGVAPIAWSNDDLPELGRDTPLETCLKESRAAASAEPRPAASFRWMPPSLVRSSTRMG